MIPTRPIFHFSNSPPRSPSSNQTEPGAFAKAFKCNFSSNIDEACCPQHDFYSFANGKWLDSNPIPDIYPAWGSFLMLRDANEERCRKILDASVPPSDPHNAFLFGLCKTFFNAAMDEVRDHGGVGKNWRQISYENSQSLLTSPR